MKKMNIGILSKRTTTLAGRMKDYFEDLEHEVNIFTAENLCINEDLFSQDFFILKSKRIIYLYAGYYLEANNIPIIPNPHLTYQHKYRIDAHYLIKQAGLISPDFLIGTKEALKSQIKDFPLVCKPLMDSGSRGVTFINNIDDLNLINDDIVYFEKLIKGTHYILYFIGDEISVSEKPPLSNEHVKMKEINPTEAMIEIIQKWKKRHGVLFGHLDVVKEESTNKIYVVDPGTFPEFTNWRYGDDPCPKICNLILKQIREKR
jgi:hypothetical protein